jgi:uncharacterized membrane protein YtjA (UPF0391 family)
LILQGEQKAEVTESGIANILYKIGVVFVVTFIIPVEFVKAQV